MNRFTTKLYSIFVYILHEELIDEFFEGLISSAIRMWVTIFILFPNMGLAQTPAQEIRVVKTRVSGMTYYEIPGRKLVEASGKNTPEADKLYEGLWKEMVVKTLIEAGEKNPKEFGVQFTPETEPAFGDLLVMKYVAAAFGGQTTLYETVKTKQTELKIGVIPSPNPGGVIAQVGLDFSLFDNEEISLFASDLLDAIEAEGGIEVIKEPDNDHRYSFVLAMPESKMTVVKEIIFDHLKKSGYEVIYRE